MAVLSLERIAESGQVDIQEHGLKTEGLVDLMILRNELGLDYEVPNGFVVPVSGALPIEMKKALYDLTSDETDKVMLLARSSSPHEEPGKFTTVPVLFDPQDKQGSYERFLEAYKTVVGEEPKAVIAQKIVGDQTERDGRNVFGLTNSSFILQAPSFNPDQIAISSARGLADRVVGEDASGVIFIDYDFVNGKIVRVVDRPDRFYEHHDLTGYRQTDAECFDLSTGKVMTVSLSDRRFSASDDSGSIRSGFGESFTVPFRGTEIENLANVVLALREKKEKAVEVEGAYVNGKLHLFQLRELEALPFHNIEFSEGKYVIGSSDMAMGSGRYTMDLVMFGSGVKRNVVGDSVAGQIAGLMEDYEDRPFFAYIDHFHGALLNQLGENCRIIGTGCYENMQSHTVGVVRGRIARGDMDLYLNQCAFNVGYFTERGGRAPDKEYAGGSIQVWKDITVESDGRTARIFFDDDDPETAGRYKLDGLEVISLEEARKSPDDIAGKVITHPEYDLALKISDSGHAHTNIVNGRDWGNGMSSARYTLANIEEQFEHLIDFYKMEKKPQIPTE
jgi:hypothetical protein